MSQKWICNKCGYETTEKPKHKNETCKNCNKGRFAVKSLGQYTNTKAENLFIVRKNGGLKEGEK